MLGVITVFEEAGGERVAEGMACDGLDDTGQARGSADRFLGRAGVNVMAPHDTGAWVRGEAFGREQILPGPFPVGVGVLGFESVGQVYRAISGGRVLGVHVPYPCQMLLQGRQHGFRQQSNAVSFSFAVAHDDQSLLEIDVFDAQT